MHIVVLTLAALSYIKVMPKSWKPAKLDELVIFLKARAADGSFKPDTSIPWQ
jgi:hypothetical protein